MPMPRFTALGIAISGHRANLSPNAINDKGTLIGRVSVIIVGKTVDITNVHIDTWSDIELDK